MGTRNGILVRDRLALEAEREVDVVIFDFILLSSFCL